MEDKRIQVMTILQDYFCKDTPLDVATDSILRLFSVVGRSEQLKAVEKLKDFAYEVCPLHREDDLEEIVGSL